MTTEAASRIAEWNPPPHILSVTLPKSLASTLASTTTPKTSDENGYEEPGSSTQPSAVDASLASEQRPARVTTSTVTPPSNEEPKASWSANGKELYHVLADVLAGRLGTPDGPISPEFLEALRNRDWKNGRLHPNPKARQATPAQRRELMRRDGYCCATPGCPNHTWLELHHIVRVVDDGDTVTYNLVTLCSGCHRNVHKGLLRIDGDADQRLTFRDADGRDLGRAYGLEIAGWLNLHTGWKGLEEYCHMQRWAADDGPPVMESDDIVAAAVLT